ncbi:transmembrane emp24 domain-containing protein 1 isoform X3 [Sus scrofa]|uniref:transmembrane emp24 domain-containing protein 1 isoform X3 n=1 Tax=Sus scrofa TaxID=9823 RepID=UPI000A2AFC4A|nr:transmembrane emp24 domain-containing protein 1 isoform X3 [Sus scrofa]
MFRTKAGLEMGERGGGAIERGRPSAGRTLAGGRGLKRCQLRWRRGHDVAQEREWPTRGFPGERVKARASSKAPLYYLGCGQAGHNLVIAGAGLDVDFTLESPQGVLLVSESRKADGVHTVEPTEAGDYKLCFDNSFSTISEKLVFFELIFDSLQDDEEVEGWAEAVEPEEMLDVKMEDIKVCPGGGVH